MTIILDAGIKFTSDIQTILQTNEHRTGHNIILSLPEQQSGGVRYKIHEMHNQKRPWY